MYHDICILKQYVMIWIDCDLRFYFLARVRMVIFMIWIVIAIDAIIDDFLDL